MTNGDKIRNMSNEELIQTLSGSKCCMCAYKYMSNCFGENCNDGVAKWLKQEVEE